MPIIKWDPFQELDKFFDDLPSTFGYGRDLAVDLFEEDNNIIAEMHIPDIDPEKIEVSVEDGYLHVSGRREETKEEKDKHYYRKEIRRGSFERAIAIPGTVDKDNVKAEYDNGKLRITMSKVSGGKKGKVKIEVKK